MHTQTHTHAEYKQTQFLLLTFSLPRIHREFKSVQLGKSIKVYTVYLRSVFVFGPPSIMQKQHWYIRSKKLATFRGWHEQNQRPSLLLQSNTFQIPGMCLTKDAVRSLLLLIATNSAPNIHLSTLCSKQPIITEKAKLPVDSKVSLQLGLKVGSHLEPFTQIPQENSRTWLCNRYKHYEYSPGISIIIKANAPVQVAAEALWTAANSSQVLRDYGTMVTHSLYWTGTIHTACLIGLQDNSPTNQLAVSQVVDWTTRGLVNSLTTNFFKTWNYYTLCIKPNPNSNPIEYWQRINSVIV